MYFKGILIFIAVGSITSLPFSPCPDLFRYTSEEKNQWTGTLTLISDTDLHGVWIRLIFDEKYDDVIVPENFGTKPSDDHKELLIHSREFLLEDLKPTEIQITIKHNGAQIPKLVTYRLNARMICSENDKNNYFSGDSTSKDFLTDILSQKAPSKYSQIRDCEVTVSSDLTDFNDTRSKPGQWPWHAAIYFRRHNKENYVCSGSLISSRHILTAAHCVNYNGLRYNLPPKHLGVKLGAVNINSDQSKIVDVEKVSIYPGYLSDNLLNDLAVITLEKPVTIDDRVRPVCLSHENIVGGEGYLVSYGFEGKTAPLLSQAKINVAEKERCANDKQISSLISDNNLCGSYVSDNSACVGDSGSGLVTLRRGSKPVWELNGIVSISPILKNVHRCAKDETILLTDVSRYLTWIQDIIA